MTEPAQQKPETQIQPSSATGSMTPGGAVASSGMRADALKASLRGYDYETQVQMLRPEAAPPRATTEDVHGAAAKGISGSGGALPDQAMIQNSFGGYDISNVQAHTDSAAHVGASAMGAAAYATGNHIVLGKGGADLHTQAHEAAHVIQQKAGVSLSGGVGQAGDAHEQHADRVADAVVQGKSAEGILAEMLGGGGGGGVQMLEFPCSERMSSTPYVQRREATPAEPGDLAIEAESLTPIIQSDTYAFIAAGARRHRRGDSRRRHSVRANPGRIDGTICLSAHPLRLGRG